MRPHSSNEETVDNTANSHHISDHKEGYGSPNIAVYQGLEGKGKREQQVVVNMGGWGCSGNLW